MRDLAIGGHGRIPLYPREDSRERSCRNHEGTETRAPLSAITKFSLCAVCDRNVDENHEMGGANTDRRPRGAIEAWRDRPSLGREPLRCHRSNGLR